jgi:hypothetical protein
MEGHYTELQSRYNRLLEEMVCLSAPRVATETHQMEMSDTPQHGERMVLEGSRQCRGTRVTSGFCRGLKKFIRISAGHVRKRFSKIEPKV